MYEMDGKQYLLVNACGARAASAAPAADAPPGWVVYALPSK